MPNKEIYTYTDTQANLISLLESKMRGIDNDVGKNWSYVDQSDVFHVTANQKYWSGSAWVYEDNSFGTVTITSGKKLITATVNALNTNGLQLGKVSTGAGILIDDNGNVKIDNHILVQNNKYLRLGGTHASPYSHVQWNSSTVELQITATTGHIVLATTYGYVKILNTTSSTSVLDEALVIYNKISTGTVASGFGSQITWKLDGAEATPIVYDVAHLAAYWVNITNPLDTNDDYCQVGLLVSSVQDSMNKKLIMSWDALVTTQEWWCICYANMIIKDPKYITVNFIKSTSSDKDLTLTGFNYAAGLIVKGGTSNLEIFDEGTTPTDLYSDVITNYSDVSTIVGWSSYTTKKIYYKRIGRLVFVWFDIQGVSDATSASFTLPYANSVAGGSINAFCGIRARDNGNGVAAYVYISDGAKTVSMVLATGVWTASGTKQTSGTLFYEADSLA